MVDKIKEKHKISVVLPVYNEEDCIEETLYQLEKIRQNNDDGPDLEFIFVDDGSIDATVKIIREHMDKNSFVKLIEFTRNFGHQIAITAGIDAAFGDFIAIIDSDLQDPPEHIIDMYKIAIKGFDVVYGLRKTRSGETLLKKVSAYCFYWFINRVSDTEVPHNTGDFRLISRRAANVLKNMPERHRFIRGMVPWTGFKSVAFEYNRKKRFAGKTKYPMRKMANFAFEAVLSFSSKPIILTIYLGLIVAVIGFLGSFYILMLKLLSDQVVPGITSIILFITMFSGVQIFLIGVVGSYVAKIFEEVKKRPLYVIKESTNL